MQKGQSIEAFYEKGLKWMPDNFKKEIGHFNVFSLDDYCGSNAKPMPYSRKHFYKISLVFGSKRLYYADKVIETGAQCLIFANPLIPYKMETVSAETTGYFCIFTDAFFSQFGAISDYPVFQPKGQPVYELSLEQAQELQVLFQRMMTEIGSDYLYKYDVLRTLVFELIHQTLKMQPSLTLRAHHSNASERIASSFMELLERQFPIESPSQQLALRSPQEYAQQLAIHVNHLNRALKETTGKTTSLLLSERVSQEAKALLRHTTWNVGQIADSLGFDELSNFVKFFKKNVGLTPTAFRSN